MSAGAKRPATYEELEALPPNYVGEIIEGELFASPRPAFAHANTCAALGGELYAPFTLGRGGPGGWWILIEPELHFGDNVLVPDLAGWRRERMREFPRPEEHFTKLAPDWVCEIFSPRSALYDRQRKLPLYAHEQVRHVWLIDPLARRLEVFRLERNRWLSVSKHSEDEKVRPEPFDAVELELGGLWLP